MPEPKISIVVLGYNRWDLSHQLLMDIKRFCSDVHEVVFVDNASEDQNVALGLEFWLGLKVIPLRVVRLAKNRGFVGGMNFGIEKSTGDIILLFSNDVKITDPNFLSWVKVAFQKDKKILLGDVLYNYDTGWNKFGTFLVPYLSGHFLAATKDFWSRIKFDDLFSPSDYEDVDLSYHASLVGYSLVTLPANTLHHQGGGTFGYTEERLARTKRNRIRFADKWGLTRE